MYFAILDIVVNTVLPTTIFHTRMNIIENAFLISSKENIKIFHCDYVQTESQYSSLKPNDTIFVKSVKENSPAKQAGLCEGGKTHTKTTHRKKLEDI